MARIIPSHREPGAISEELEIRTTVATSLSSPGMLHPASSPPLAAGSNSALPSNVAQEECEEAVDWETIAGYLSRCQSSQLSLPSLTTTTSILPPPTQILCIPPPRDLRRRAPQGIPPSMNKNPTNPQPQSTPPPSPTATMASTGGGLSTGAKAAIAGGAAVGIVILLAGFVALHTHRRRKKFGYRTKGKDRNSMTSEFSPTKEDKDGEEMQMLRPDPEPSTPGIHTGLGISHDIGRQGGYTNQPTMFGGNQSPSFSTERPLHTVPLINTTTPPTPFPPVHQADYQVSPTMESHRMYNSPSLRPRSSTGQTYNTVNSTTSFTSLQSARTVHEESGQEFDQHNQRSRPSHPLSGLSEAIPPPPLQKREHHEMADYQSAVPLGFANGFVQVEHVGELPPVSNPSTNPNVHPMPIRGQTLDEYNSIQITPAGYVREVATGYMDARANGSASRNPGANGSGNIYDGEEEEESLPVYEPNPALQGGGDEKVFKKREEGDTSDSEDEERRFETHLTKSDLG